MKAFEKVAKEMKIKTLYIRLKDCEDEVEEIEIPDLEKKIVNKISSILHFTATNSIKSSFDLLITSECNDIDCLINFAEKRYRNDIAVWITSRLIILKKRFIRNNNKLVIYKCLEEYDELIRRLNIGLIYALRSHIKHLLLKDDALAVVLNSLYGNIWPLMVRPYLASFNFWPETRDLLQFDPVILAPGSDYGGLYRLTSDKYIVMYRRRKWELSPDEVYALAHS
jgi:hypothetical protein